MRKVSLEEIKNGEKFTLDGVEFVKLCEDHGVAFAVTADVILEEVSFDSERETGRNNFVGSEIEAAMLEWLDGHPGIEGAVVKRPIDLTSMDGMTDYGKPVVKARLLTIYEYRKNRALIPLTSVPYWTATPRTTESSPYSDSYRAYYVRTDGTLNYYYVAYPRFAARPALYLKSDIFVSVENDEEEDGREKKDLEYHTDEIRTRKDVLAAAEKCVCGQREEDYGTPEDNFKLIAELWTPVIRMCVSPGADVCVLPEAVTLMMALVKVARLINSPEHLDSWVDLAGYAACGGEISGGGNDT